MDVKKEHKFFMLPDFNEEQAFLEEQHRLGWKFVSFKGINTYVFKKCTPEEYSYQLDYKEDNEDEDSYLQLYKDCGWEYIMKYNYFYYFRKANPNKDEDMSIFSDTASKATMIEGIMKRQRLISIGILPLFLFNIYLIVFNDFFGGNTFLVFIDVIIMFLYFIVFGLHLRNYSKLQKLINSLK
jgi:hypothetical protein